MATINLAVKEAYDKYIFAVPDGIAQYPVAMNSAHIYKNPVVKKKSIVHGYIDKVIDMMKSFQGDLDTDIITFSCHTKTLRFDVYVKNNRLTISLGNAYASYINLSIINGEYAAYFFNSAVTTIDNFDEIMAESLVEKFEEIEHMSKNIELICKLMGIEGFADVNG